MPTSRCKTSALKYGLAGSIERRSGGVSLLSSLMARLSHSARREASPADAEASAPLRRLDLEIKPERHQHGGIGEDGGGDRQIELQAEALAQPIEDRGAGQHRDDPHDL